MTVFRAQPQLFRAPGTPKTPVNTGAFRVFRAIRANARIRERLFRARAHYKRFSRVYVKVHGTPGTFSNGKASARHTRPERTRNTRNANP